MLATFIGVSRENWAVWGTWAGVAVTFLLGAGALWIAWRQLGHLRVEARNAQEASEQQLEAIQGQVKAAAEAVAQARESSDKQLAAMEAARRQSIRPFVYPTAASLRELADRVTALRVEFANHGLGPALGIRAFCWWATMPDQLVTDDKPLLELLDKATTGRPMGQLDLPAFLTPGETRNAWVTAPHDTTMYPLHFEPGVYLVVIRGKYQGVEDTVYEIPEPGWGPFANVSARLTL